MIPLAVAAGGACGALLRYALTGWLGSPGGFPLATLTANVSGSLLIGVLYVFVTQRWGVEHPAHAFLALGLLGGFTTFSSFSLETVRLLEQARWLLAGTYVSASLLLCLGGAGLGIALARRLG